MWTVTESLPGIPGAFIVAPWALTAIAVIGWIITAILKARQHTRLGEEITNLRTDRDRIKAERDKLQAEAIVAAGTTLQQKQEARRAHRDACVKTKMATLELIRLVKADDPGMAGQRERVCATIADEVLSAFHDYCEWTKLELKHHPKEMEAFILKVVCPELARIAEWVGICNHKRFLNQYNLSRLEITGSTVHVYGELCTNLPQTKQADVGKFLTRSIEAVLRA